MNRIISILFVIAILSLFMGGCSSKPNPEDAFSYAAGYANKELATYQNEPFLNPGCDHRPIWDRLDVRDLGNGRYLVSGRVVVGNVYCVKDQSDFTATIRYDDSIWYLEGPIKFSNLCVLHRTYQNIPDQCLHSQWILR